MTYFITVTLKCLVSRQESQSIIIDAAACPVYPRSNPQNTTGSCAILFITVCGVKLLPGSNSRLLGTLLVTQQALSSRRTLDSAIRLILLAPGRQ